MVYVLCMPLVCTLKVQQIDLEKVFLYNAPTYSPDPTQWPMWKKCACPNTVKFTKIYRYAASWIFLKRKGGFLYKSIGTKEILYPYLVKVPTSLPAVIVLTPYCQGVRWVISCPKYNALNRPICRVDGSVSKVLVGSLLEGERISSK